LPRGARFASILGIDVERLRGLGLVVNAIHAAPSPELLGRLGTKVAEGRLRIPVHKVYALEQVPQALVDLADGGKLGKLSVSVAS
jgi:NADPH-dependent curcumin reductase CurA